MCLMLYIATSHEPQRMETPQLRVEDVDPRRTAVRQWFTLPVVTARRTSGAVVDSLYYVGLSRT